MQEGGALLVESSSPHALADSAQSPDYSGPLPGKSKKRDRPDQNAIASKKDQLNEDYASPQKRECVEKFADEDGGLLNIHAVEQLILKMKQDRASLQRNKLLGVVVATMKEDCLRKFVQMGGVPILEEWIQDGLNSRSSDASLKDSDKNVDEEMLMILQALEKLPIDLEALKGCSIGKSVKRLRSIRNVELQKKARKLVDTWKKRVNFEMNQINAEGHEPNVHVDSISHSSDLSPARGIEGTTAPSELTTPFQEVNETTLVSTVSNTSTSDASPKAHEKSSISSEKDASKKMMRLCSMSASTLSPAKRQKNLATLTTDKDCKEELLNVTGVQKLKEKDTKCENGIVKNDPTSNAACDTRKTNEYRKKLRSGGSSPAVCSTDLHASVSPSNAVQAMINADEKDICIDNSTGDSEQVPKRSLATKGINTLDGSEAPDPPGLSSIKPGCKEVIPTETNPQDRKMDHVNESCLSSQSSCTDKQTDMSPRVTFETTKMNSHTSPLQADTKLSSVSQQVDGSSGGVLRPSMKSTSSMDDCSGEGVHKSSTSDPNVKPLNASTAVMLKRSELADAQQGGAVECEESCCSYDNVENLENTQRESSEYPSSHVTLQKDGCLLDGTAYSESSKANVNVSEEAEKEQFAKIDKKVKEVPATTHSCHEFDLNEGLAMDEFLQDSQPLCVPHVTCTSSALPGLVKSTSTLSAPVAVSAASKGAFIPPLNSIHKCDIGWTGSAATSAFRPAEPRHAPAKVQSSLLPNEGRNVNCFDLNVADQGTFEDCPPASAVQRHQEAHLDLNCDGKDVEMEISTSISESAMHLPLGCVEKLPEKGPVRDFDLNEQLDEVQLEQEVLSTSAAGRFNGVLPFGGLNGYATSGDAPTWHSAGKAPFQVTVGANVARTEQFFAGPVGANVARTEQFFASSMNQPVASARQTTSTAGGPPPLSSVVYSQTAPFFGGAQIPFPASFAYSPVSAGMDSPYLGSKMVPSQSVSSVGGRSRPETSLVRPGFTASMDDLRGGNSFYTWGRPHQNMYGGTSGPTIISYNDAAVGGREHVVNFNGNAALEEHRRLYQQAAVPVASLKRKESDYFSGLKQTTWH